MSVGSLVLGIVGLLVSLVPFFGMYAIPLTVLAVILGALGLRASTGRGMAVAGLVLGILGTVLAVWWMYATAAVGTALDDEFKKAGTSFEAEMKKSIEAAAKEAAKDAPE
jgi:hypothetical protein